MGTTSIIFWTIGSVLALIAILPANLLLQTGERYVRLWVSCFAAIAIVTGTACFTQQRYWDEDANEIGVVPASRTFTGAPQQALKVLPGEEVVIANCCEKCGHIQKGRVECLAD